MKKSFGWMLFATSAACFAVMFAKQQLDNRVADANADFSRPSPQWAEVSRRMAATSDDQPAAPATQPAGTFASSDVNDALK